MFIEASDQPTTPRRQNDRAGLVTTNVLQPGSYCFNFWYEYHCMNVLKALQVLFVRFPLHNNFGKYPALIRTVWDCWLVQTVAH